MNNYIRCYVWSITNVKVKAFEKMAIVVCLENIDSDIENKNIVRTGVIVQISLKNKMSTTTNTIMSG